MTRASQSELLQSLKHPQLAFITAAAIRSGIVDALAAGPSDERAIARSIRGDTDATARLLRGLIALNVVKEVDGRFDLSDLGRLLTRGPEGSLRAPVLMVTSPEFMNSWGRLADCIRSGTPAFEIAFGEKPFAYFEARPELRRDFDEALASISQARARSLARTFDFSGVKSLVDVGGGHGQLLIAALQANPQLRGVLLDHASVLEGAHARIAAAGLSERVQLVAGDFFQSVPADGDVYILSAVLHDWSDEDAQRILSTCSAAMNPAARLIVAERLLPDRLVAGDPDALQVTLSDMNMLLFGGRERRLSEFVRLLESARLALVRAQPIDSGFHLVEAAPVAGGQR